MNYETLDSIADSYIPILAITAFLTSVLVSSDSQSRVKMIFFRLMCLSILLGLAYGFMFLDNAYSIWPNLGLDYSTHTAVSLVLVLFLGLLIPRLLLFWSFSLVVYCGLMLYQEYHTVADILSTAFVLIIVMATVLTVGKANKLLHSEKVVAALPFFR